MTCPACASQPSGQVNSDCRACALRELAIGPLFLAVAGHSRLTDAYKAAIRRILAQHGGEFKETHEDVKAAAKAYATGARG